jgi:hypothetical protein
MIVRGVEGVVLPFTNTHKVTPDKKNYKKLFIEVNMGGLFFKSHVNSGSGG